MATKKEESFTKAVVDTLLRRAANHCSNPECNALTSGPSKDMSKAVLIGEAAHIFGAKFGSARFDALMSNQERRAITNAIWLCRNCHKIVDADPHRFPADLLFQWRFIHEDKMDREIGRTNEAIRRKIAEDETPEFERLSNKARQIIYDKPEGWEYLLTADVLRHFCEPTLLRWRALKKGLYVKPISRIADNDALLWTVDRLSELGITAPACTLICNQELLKAWGPLGQSASSKAIVLACQLFASNCQQLLQWEETMRFTALPDAFNEVKSALVGIGGRMLEQISIVPQEMAKIFGDNVTPGRHEINFVIDVPEGFSERMDAIISELGRRLNQ